MRQVTFDRPSLRMRLLLYGAAPLVLLGGMAAMYYSDVPWLRHIVAPELTRVAPDTQREFGLLELLQDLALAALAVVAGVGLRRERAPCPRLVLWAALVGGLFMLMEETDYGMHFVEFARGGEHARGEVTGYHNIHRLGYTAVVLRNVATFGMLTFFGGFAIVFAGSRNATLRRLAPDRMSVLTILLVTAVQEVVWRLAARVPDSHGSLSGNEIEFTELGMYGLALLYVTDLVFWRNPLRTGGGE